MSGHSKWSSIKHKKGAADAKRGKIFSRISKELTVVAKAAGGDPTMNPRLRTVIANAKAANMPADNIERAIKKGVGEIGGASSFEETTYEGYGPGGVALLVEVLTDNKNRTVAEIRHILSKHGGNLGENGCVAWMFDKKGSLLVNKSDIDEDALMELALEAGADDVREEEHEFEVITSPGAFETVRRAIEQRGIKLLSASIGMIPQNTVQLEAARAEQMIKLMEKLEDNDDVQNVYANFDIPDEIMEKLS